MKGRGRKGCRWVLTGEVPPPRVKQSSFSSFFLIFPVSKGILCNRSDLIDTSILPELQGLHNYTSLNLLYNQPITRFHFRLPNVVPNSQSIWKEVEKKLSGRQRLFSVPPWLFNTLSKFPHLCIKPFLGVMSAMTLKCLPLTITHSIIQSINQSKRLWQYFHSFPGMQHCRNFLTNLQKFECNFPGCEIKHRISTN